MRRLVITVQGKHAILTRAIADVLPVLVPHFRWPGAASDCRWFALALESWFSRFLRVRRFPKVFNNSWIPVRLVGASGIDLGLLSFSGESVTATATACTMLR
jgi:hypothetical protein